MTNYVYLHARPNTVTVEGIFYVGKGRNNRYRQMSHRNLHHSNVVAKHGKDNILISKIDSSSEEVAFELERGLIKCLRRMRVSLANQTDGGEGASGYVRSDESKARIRGNKFAAGRTRSIAHRKAISEAQLGNKHTLGYVPTLETRQKISAALKGHPGIMTGRTHSEETKAKIGAKLLGRSNGPMKEETKAKLSAIVKLQMTEEAREHLSKLNIGKKQSAETIEKRRISRQSTDLTKTKESVLRAICGSKWMYFHDECRRVLPDNQTEYLSLGWKFGRKEKK